MNFENEFMSDEERKSMSSYIAKKIEPRAAKTIARIIEKTDKKGLSALFEELAFYACVYKSLEVIANDVSNEFEKQKLDQEP